MKRQKKSLKIRKKLKYEIQRMALKRAGQRLGEVILFKSAKLVLRQNSSSVKQIFLKSVCNSVVDPDLIGFETVRRI
jgi:hypothetical protein